MRRCKLFPMTWGFQLSLPPPLRSVRSQGRKLCVFVVFNSLLSLVILITSSPYICIKLWVPNEPFHGIKFPVVFAIAHELFLRRAWQVSLLHHLLLVTRTRKLNCFIDTKLQPGEPYLLNMLRVLYFWTNSVLRNVASWCDEALNLYLEIPLPGDTL